MRSKTLNEHLTFTVVERADFSFLLGHSGGGKSSRCFDPLTALSNYIIFSRIETSFFKRKSTEELICFVCIGPKRPLLVVCCDKTSKNRHWEDSVIAECIPPIINLNRYYAFRGKQPILCLSPRAGIFERPSRRDRFERIVHVDTVTVPQQLEILLKRKPLYEGEGERGMHTLE